MHIISIYGFSQKSEINSTFHLVFFLFLPFLIAIKFHAIYIVNIHLPKNKENYIWLCVINLGLRISCVFFCNQKMQKNMAFFFVHKTLWDQATEIPTTLATWSSFRWVSFICRSLAFLAARTPAMAVSLKKWGMEDIKTFYGSDSMQWIFHLMDVSLKFQWFQFSRFKSQKWTNLQNSLPFRGC